MMTLLSLRLRVFLFFALLGLGGIAVTMTALWVGYQRAVGSDVVNGFALSGIMAVLGLGGLTAGIWLLFDENVAKPIEYLSAELRLQAHTDTARDVASDSARYLGDLAPAANALSLALSDQSLDTTSKIASRTHDLETEKACLAEVLSCIPMATILLNPQWQIVLYDAQAAEMLASQGPLRLNASIHDYFAPGELTKSVSDLATLGASQRGSVLGADTRQCFDMMLTALETGGAVMVLNLAEGTWTAKPARAVTYDFDLMSQSDIPLDTRPLSQLTFTVFDTETTGLSPDTDDIVQIGAVRVLNGRLIETETLDLLVNPGRPIPAASTRIHKISDQMVQGHPPISKAGQTLHKFAQQSVIVAHNAPFDVAFLTRHAAEMDVVWNHTIIDTVHLSAILFGASQTHTLDALCDRLSIAIPPQLRHTALGDAMATAQALVQMIPMLEARNLSTLPNLLAQTKRHNRLLKDLNA